MGDDILHAGVKGMKWGVRKDRPLKDDFEIGETVLEKKLKNGGSVTVVRRDLGLATRLLGRATKTDVSKYRSFVLKDSRGKKVGTALFQHDSKDALYLSWLGVNKSQRGKGYGTAAFEGAVNYAKKNGISKLGLYVIDESKDARHIYEKFGFRDGVDTSKRASDFGGDDGFTYMELKIPKKSISHSDLFNEHMMLDLISEAANALPEEDPDQKILAHAGVKGMKWGVRKGRGTPRAARKPSSDFKKTQPLRKKKSYELSNKQLKDLTTRMQLEQNYSKLNPGKGAQGKAKVTAILTTAGLGISAYNLATSPAAKAGAKVIKAAVNAARRTD